MSRLLRRIIALVVVIVLIGLVLQGYKHEWTGFGPSLDAQGKAMPGKVLWDWLDLLIVPLVLAVGAWLLDGSRKRAERRIEDDRQRQQVLHQYFDYITPLLAEGKLDAEHSRYRSIVRNRTLTALRLLDGRRKAQLVQFIYEAGLITRPPTIQLTGANLDGADLDEATLAGAEIRGAYMRGASLRDANLREADLRGSDLSKADMRRARLPKADLRQVILRHAHIEDADLTGALTDQIDATHLSPRCLKVLAASERSPQEGQ